MPDSDDLDNEVRLLPSTTTLARWRAELQHIALSLRDPPAPTGADPAGLRARIAEQDLALRQSLELIWHLEAARLEGPAASGSATELELETELQALRSASRSRPVPGDSRRETLTELAARMAGLRARLDALPQR